MTIRANLILCAGFLLIALTAMACASARGGGLGPEQLEKYPPEVREAYGLFEKKCSRCHPVSRPLNAEVNDVEHWRRYVARMRRHPGSGISESDAETILVFLEYYTRSRTSSATPSAETVDESGAGS